MHIICVTQHTHIRTTHAQRQFARKQYMYFMCTPLFLLSIFLSLPPSLFFSLFPSLSPSLPLSLFFPISLPLSLSLSHPLSLTLTLSVSLFLSPSQVLLVAVVSQLWLQKIRRRAVVRIKTKVIEKKIKKEKETKTEKEKRFERIIIPCLYFSFSSLFSSSVFFLFPLPCLSFLFPLTPPLTSLCPVSPLPHPSLPGQGFQEKFLNPL
jgi:hypothetical protein